MANSSDKRNSVIANLRACLISSQGGIRMESLNSDYLQIIGETIPFKTLGYTELEDFLRSIPEINVKRIAGDILIEAKETQESSHVTQLVSKQKKSGKKKSKPSRNISRTRHSRTSVPRFFKKANKSPLITNPVFSLQKQCYLPLQISVPQNNNVINSNSRIVSELSKKGNKHKLRTTSNHDPNEVERSSLSSQFPPKNVNYPSLNIIEKSLIPILSDNLMMQSYNSSFNEPSLPPTSNFNNSKESLCKSQAEYLGRSSPPVLHEGSSKKIKQSAQNRLNQIRKQNKLLVSVHLQHGESSSPYQRQLSYFVQERGWEEPAYKILKNNGGKHVYYCTLSILIPRMAPNLAPEPLECGTFSNDFYDVNEAKECVAKQALEKLKKREIFNTYLIIQDPALILQRVELMVKKKDTGKWASRIEDEHRTLFKEILPSHWLDVVYASKQFIIEELANSSLLIKAKENAIPFPPPVDLTIPKLVLPKDNTWDVFVTRAASVNDVCIRFIGDDYSGMLDSLTSDMEMWYQHKENLINPFLIVGEYYVSYCNESWARVVVLKINLDDIHVRFIDHGDDDILPRSALYRLEPKFMSLPAQAVTVSLKNLDNYKNYSEGPDYLTAYVVGICLVAVVEQRAPRISLTLFDTSQEEALNLNEKLESLFNLNYREQVKIEEGGVYQVFVSFIDESGTVYVQFKSETLEVFSYIMGSIEDGSYDNFRIKNYSELHSDKIYLLVQIDIKYRVKISNAKNSNGQVLVRFIDSGREDSVFIEDLYNLEEISYWLSHAPPQALAVRLHEVAPHNFTQERMFRFKEMLSGKEAVVAKIRNVQDGIPIIELFKRTFPDNLMASINQTLILDNTLNNVANKLEQLTFKPSPKVEKSALSALLLKIDNNYPSGSIERKIAKNRPVLPDIGEEFQILVQQTANPSFIMVQPLEYVNIINSLEKDMCDYYNNCNSGINFKIHEESFCVVRDKSCWYRAYIDKVIDSQSVSVKLLDYGSVSIVHNTDIKPLKEQFMKVPFVGFCCKIHGIIPKHGDWSVDDCLTTRMLIDHKKLTAQIKGILLSQTSLGGTILELQLLDMMNTMTGSRLDIGEVLVQKGCAKYKDL